MDIKEIRRKNIQTLCDHYGRSIVAKKMEYSDTVYLNQLYGGHSNCGDVVARKFEEAFQLTRGWMDAQHEEEDPEISNFFMEIGHVLKDSPPSVRDRVLNFAKFAAHEQHSEQK